MGADQATVRTSICRACNAFCPVDVTIEAGQVTKVTGNRRAPLYRGFSCPKGRILPKLHNMPERLLHSLKRQPDGSFKPISSADLTREIGEKIASIIERHGPRSVATYLSGGVIEQPAASTLMISFLEAIGSPMMFSASTIDQPGMNIGYALHGRWLGGRIKPEELDVYVVVGGNPINSKQFLPQNPGMQIKAMRRRGAKLIVIDPRRSETARLADIHLQAIPGEDPTILAGLAHLVIAGGGVDEAFVAQNAHGYEALAEAVRPFTPAYVAARAGLDEGALREAAQVLIESEKGDLALGTGPSMATRGVLSSYLALAINTLRGFWAREGSDAMHPSVLLPPREFRAQPASPTPAWGYGEQTRIRGLEETPAGMPVAALPDEILTPGEGQVKALFLHGGVLNSWPQQDKTIEALRALDLLVIHDTVLSPTAKMADYVIATRMQLEIPAMTLLNEMISAGGHSGYGWSEPFAYYGPALVDPPAGSDLLESWQIYYRMAQRLGVDLKVVNWKSNATNPPRIDMTREPKTEDLYQLMCAGSAVAPGEVARHRDGKVFESCRRRVRARDPGCTDFLELGNEEMLAELHAVAGEPPERRRRTDSKYRFLLIPSRLQNSTNTFYKPGGLLKWSYNPAFMNPDDMRSLQLQAGDSVRIRSRHGEVTAFVEEDDGLRPGVVAMMHGFGGSPGPGYDPRRDGANVNQLTAWEDDNDPHTGMPRMGALPVSVEAAQAP